MPAQHSICLFGGTFDPIHLGHTYIAQLTKNLLNIDQFIFLPCHTSPHKLDTKTAAPTHRLEMCQLATQSLPWATVSDHDITITPSFSWKTAEYFKAQYPNSKLYWLMGTDQWNALDRWGRYDYFIELVEIIVFTRGNEQLKQYDFINPDQYHILEGNHPASASAIRNHFLLSPTAPPWLHPNVSQYISDNQLYCEESR